MKKRMLKMRKTLRNLHRQVRKMDPVMLEYVLCGQLVYKLLNVQARYHCPLLVEAVVEGASELLRNGDDHEDHDNDDDDGDLHGDGRRGGGGHRDDELHGDDRRGTHHGDDDGAHAEGCDVQAGN